MTRKAPTGAKHSGCITHVQHPYMTSGWLCITTTAEDAAWPRMVPIGPPSPARIVNVDRPADMVGFADHLTAVRADHRARELARFAIPVLTAADYAETRVDPDGRTVIVRQLRNDAAAGTRHLPYDRADDRETRARMGAELAERKGRAMPTGARVAEPEPFVPDAPEPGSPESLAAAMAGFAGDMIATGRELGILTAPDIGPDLAGEPEPIPPEPNPEPEPSPEPEPEPEPGDDAADAYVRRIRNGPKRAYAAAYLAFLRAPGPFGPLRGNVSYMAAQAVRMELGRLSHPIAPGPAPDAVAVTVDGTTVAEYRHIDIAPDPEPAPGQRDDSGEPSASGHAAAHDFGDYCACDDCTGEPEPEPEPEPIAPVGPAGPANGRVVWSAADGWHDGAPVHLTAVGGRIVSGPATGPEPALHPEPEPIAEPEPAPAVGPALAAVAAVVSDGRPVCARCGQTFRKSGTGLSWHLANRPDCKPAAPVLTVAS